MQQQLTSKKIYVKSDWQPKPGPPALENLLSLFESNLTRARNKSSFRKPATNLTTSQLSIMSSIKKDPNLIVLMCDKGLGPAVMIRSTYISEMLRQHLQDKHKTYKKMSEREATSRLSAIKIRISKITENNLPLHENKYFQLSLQSQELKIPQIYGMPKVHKEKLPVPLRPVVNQRQSLLGIPSTYLDYKLQPLTKLVPSYLKIHNISSNF